MSCLIDLDGNGTIEFEEYVRVMATYCMFTKVAIYMSVICACIWRVELKNVIWAKACFYFYFVLCYVNALVMLML